MERRDARVAGAEDLIRRALTALETGAPPPVCDFAREAFARTFPEAYAHVVIRARALDLLDRLLAADDAGGDHDFRGLDAATFGELEKIVLERLQESGDVTRLRAVAKRIRMRRNKLNRSARGAKPD